MENLSSKVIYSQGPFSGSKPEFQFSIKKEVCPNLFNIVTIHCNDCPESGFIVVNGNIISNFKHIESKGSVHTFEMWESPIFLPCVLLSKTNMHIHLKFNNSDSKESFVTSNGVFYPNSMFIKVYYQDEHDFLFKFVPHGKPLVHVDLKDGTFDIVTTTYFLND